MMIFPPKCRLTFNGLHGIMSQKIYPVIIFVIVFEALTAVVVKSSMEATNFSEASVDFQRTTQSHIPEDENFHRGGFFFIFVIISVSLEAILHVISHGSFTFFYIRYIVVLINSS
jgi:hypothetical protein